MADDFKFEWFWSFDDDDKETNLSFDDEDDSSFSWFGDDDEDDKTSWNQWQWFSWWWNSWFWWWFWWDTWWMWWFWWWDEWWAWWNEFWWMFWDITQWNNVYATRKQAYQDVFKNDWTQIQLNTKQTWWVWFFASIKQLFEINKWIYKELNLFHFALIWVCVLVLAVALFFLKELSTYVISYLTVYLQVFSWLDRFVILVLYFFWLYYILNYLDWESKYLNTIQAPIKLLLLWVWTLYLFWKISSDLLFTSFVIWIFPLTLMKLFIFNETDTELLEKIKNWLSIANVEVKQEINNIINKSADSLLWDLPEQQELLIWDVEEEEQSYQLWFEMLNRNKEVRKLSWFLIWEKRNLYYLNYVKEEMPVVE